MKAIPGFDGYYATEEGDIYSDKLGRLHKLSPRIKDGYYLVNIRQGLGRKTAKQMRVNRLVLMAFSGDGGNLECRHLNGNALDNRIVNLCWGTHKENTQDALRHGTAVCLKVGEDAPHSKLTLQQVKDIKQKLTDGMKQIEIAAIFGISQRHVSAIKHGEISLARDMGY